MAESDAEYFGRRRGEREADEKATIQKEQASQQRWQTQLDVLVREFDPKMGHLLGAFAEEAPEIDNYHIYGPEETGHQINWRIEYERGVGGTKRTIFVVLRYLQGLEGSGQIAPDCFSVEGMTGVTTIRPPTIEALREALGSAVVRA